MRGEFDGQWQYAHYFGHRNSEGTLEACCIIHKAFTQLLLDVRSGSNGKFFLNFKGGNVVLGYMRFRSTAVILVVVLEYINMIRFFFPRVIQEEILFL